MAADGDDVSMGRKGEQSASRELREFEKLDQLLTQIPKKAQHGIMRSCDLILTCIDANSTYIALGSNVGLTFLYSRKDHSIQRLKSAGNSDVITSVRLHQGIDDQLATGTASGDLVVYCMPGAMSVQKKQLQKFDVKGLHKHFITSLEWSTNGMKLYSGDKNGLICTTELDFYQGQCASSLLLVESGTEITQLDYRHKVLLVSTRQRSFVVRIDQKCQLFPVGTQERKMPGSFGACFVPGLCKVSDAKLYAARPGRRLWLADIDGAVRNTHIFSDPFSSAVTEIPLLSAGKLQVGHSDFQFGNLKWFREKEIVTWTNSALVVLDPEANCVVASQGSLNGIVDVAVVEDAGEIFLLRRHADARIVRISDKPEVTTTKVETVPMLPLMMAEPPPAGKGEEKDKETSVNTFFKKLTNPLKKLDKNLLHDSKEPRKLPPDAAVVPEPVISPDLPPVVRLASPELEGLRVFTGGNGIVDSAASTSTSLGTGAAAGTDVEASPSLAALMSATSTLGIVSNVTTDVNTTDAYPIPASAQVPEIRVQSSPQRFSSSPKAELDANIHHFRGESPVPMADDGGDDIVYKHKVKKHKKKRHKGGSLLPKEKDEDSISQVSASSQQSDEMSGTSTPHNTPAVQESPLAVIQRADDMLRQVERVLNQDRNAKVVPVVTAQSLDNKLKDTQNVVNFPVTDSPEISSQRQPAVTSTTDERSFSSADLKDKSLDQTEGGIALAKGNDYSGKETGLRVGMKSGEYKSQPSYNHDMSSLSESEQYVKSLPQGIMGPVQTEGVGKKEIHRDASEILENALANLHKSNAARDEAKLRQAEELAKKSEALTSPTTSDQMSAQSSGQDVFSEIEAIEAMDPFNKGYKKVNPADDFYSNFIDTSPESPISPIEQPPTYPSPPDATRLPYEAERISGMQDIAERRLANSWSEFTTPTNIYSLALSNNHVWFTDKSENIYYSSIGSPKGIVWRKATGYANQISVSPTGTLVWRLHRGVVYAGTKISSRHPEGLKWVEAVRDVETICVDYNCAWYVKRNGDVMMQRGLSHERPCFKSKKIECSHKIRHIVCRHGVVWAITESLRLLVRNGVSDELPEGVEWELDSRDSPPYLFSYVTIDNENIGWAIDVLGHIWFCDGVTREEPLGHGQWWQVPSSGYIVQDVTTMDMIKAVAKKFDPKKLSYVLSTNRGGLITAGSQGVWLALDFRNVLQVCRGSVQGYHWLEAQPAQMSPSSEWKLVSASIAHLDWGLIWAQHSNGDVFTFKRARTEASTVPDCGKFSHISVGPTAVWALTTMGEVYIRSGTGPHCPQGSGWVELDLSQLGDTQLVHLSCNSLYVWAVERDGVIYQRIGAKPPSDNNLSPVWLPIDTFADIVFTQVHTGPLDWMVWAIDNRRLTYVRAGITDNMPIGQEWVHVPGIQAMDLALTKTGVWALTPNGEVLFRYGIARDRPCGNYWKKIPGIFVKISASANDELWGINQDGQLMQCNVRYITRHQDASDPLLQRGLSTSSSVSDDVDWEIV